MTNYTKLCDHYSADWSGLVTSVRHLLDQMSVDIPVNVYDVTIAILEPQYISPDKYACYNDRRRIDAITYVPEENCIDIFTTRL